MKIYGLNSQRINTREWMTEEVQNQKMKIVKVKEDMPQDDGTQITDIIFEMGGGKYDGFLHKQRYFVRDEVLNEETGEVFSKGTKWQICVLAIAANMFEWVKGEAGEWHHDFGEPFDTDKLIGSEIIGDLENYFNERKGKNFPQLKNMKSLYEKEKPIQQAPEEQK